jgi:mannose-1-phosphate guanylyltransferase
MQQSSVREFPAFFGERRPSKRLAVILAGGEGSRLKILTKAIIGDDRPKQFALIYRSITEIFILVLRRLTRDFSSVRCRLFVTLKRSFNRKIKARHPRSFIV